MPADPRPHEVPYGRWFYEYVDESASSSAEVVVPVVAAAVAPTSVVDVGCGTGAWLTAFRSVGVSDVLGLDSDRVPADLRQLDGDQFLIVDLTAPPSLARTFDLAVCLEVAEHLPGSAAPTLVEFLAGLAPVVLFSAAIPGQGGEDHINEQWPAYWSDLFREHGFEPFDVLRPLFWEDDRIDWFYRQNMLMYVRSDVIDEIGLLPQMARLPSPPLALVHPQTFGAQLERLDRWRSTPLSLSAHLRQLPAAAERAIRRRLRRP